jgi:peptide/nickel transport system ATP-binding protein
MPPPLLDVADLSIRFPARSEDGEAGRARRPPPPYDVVRGVSFTVERGEFVGLVGESGSGKSLTALAILGLVPPPGEVVGGRVLLDGRDLLGLEERELRAVRGARIGLVFQEPMAALNPVLTLETQITEAVRAHRRDGRRVTARAARARALDLLELLAIPDPVRRLRSYPHQLSGGQRQRAMLAIALAAGPELLIADEPTTALDVTLQAQVLELLERLRRELGLAILLITHDLAVVAESCDRVLVLYAGEVMEAASSERLFAQPGHPYTRALLASIPVLGRPAPRGELPAIPGQVPAADRLPSGCVFHPRCPARIERCTEVHPPWVVLTPGGEAPGSAAASASYAHGARCLRLPELLGARELRA